MSTQVNELDAKEHTQKSDGRKQSVGLRENHVTAVDSRSQGFIKRYLSDEFVADAKIKTWEVMVELMGFIILNLKAIFLLFLDVYYLIIPPEERSLQGQLVLVTGAGQNLGRELSLQLARLGAKMILLDVNEEQNKITADMIRDAGGEAYSFTCDVSDQKSVAAIGTKISREFLGHMIQHNRGHIICISSVLGFIGRNNVVPYCSSKFGVKGMTEALAEEMRMERRSGVKITAVHPFLISNIEDVTPNLKYPWLFEILEPSDAASRIIRGVRRGQEEIFLPEKLKPLMVFSKVLPRKLRRLFGDYVEK
ncbi:epidermal retinol dehydrogenase 2 isoform X3 [Cherax quadricarinatus]|uniref:epidermal retinol dehydrogenase 2 isoform X3 n=1 Tax=Cherax quadricarinatus TaxID=27406 RepID=UPI00387E3DDC